MQPNGPDFICFSGNFDGARHRGIGEFERFVAHIGGDQLGNLNSRWRAQVKANRRIYSREKRKTAELSKTMILILLLARLLFVSGIAIHAR